jgi:hypothetical protein
LELSEAKLGKLQEGRVRSHSKHTSMMSRQTIFISTPTARSYDFFPTTVPPLSAKKPVFIVLLQGHALKPCQTCARVTNLLHWQASKESRLVDETLGAVIAHQVAGAIKLGL